MEFSVVEAKTGVLLSFQTGPRWALSKTVLVKRVSLLARLLLLATHLVDNQVDLCCMLHSKLIPYTLKMKLEKTLQND